MRRKQFKPSSTRFLLVPALLAAAVIMVGGYTAIRSSQAEERLAEEPTVGIVIKYKTGTNLDSLRERLQQLRGDIIGNLSQQRLEFVQVPESEREQTLQDLSVDPRVEYAEPDYVYTEHAVPNDSLYPQQWEWEKVQGPTAWDTTKGSASTVVAVIDSGINFSHPDLANKTVKGIDILNGDNDPSDDRYHGTQVSGVVAAVTNNKIGVAGGCWECKIMPIKVANPNGQSNNSNITKGIQFAIDNGAKVVVMSLGGPSASKAMADTITSAVTKGIVVVASAGNSATGTPQYPANYGNVISVSATDKNDALTSYSNFGSYIDVAAPGNAQTTSYPGDTYKSANGTSFSAPMVAAVAALLRSGFPKATVAEITAAITSTAETCCDGKINGGRMNAAKAVAYLAQKYPGTTPTPTPNPTPTPPLPPLTPSSPTPSPTPPTTPPTPPASSPRSPDLNGDGRVNLTDLSMMLAKWDKADSKADLNRSGKVDIIDLSILLSQYNK